MEPEFVWRDELNIGVETIDKEHERLFKIISKIFAMREEEKDRQWACQEGIKFFKGHAVKHFEDEEAYMASIHYPNLAEHRRIHESFRDHTLPTLEKELEASEYAADAMDHFLGVCAGWLIGHTLTEDQAIVGRSQRQWDRLLPGEEMAALRKLLVQLMFDMFQLESHLISDSYGGERFGKGIYYRLVYGKLTEEAPLEVFMVFEEKLLVNTIGKVLGFQTGKLDTMLLHATRYTARQFVGRVLEQMPDGDSYGLQEESLLSYEQFQKSFGRQKMQISLLFDTGAGYFAYCAAARKTLDGQVGTPLVEKNVKDEVEKYLNRQKRQIAREERDHRPKILIVDDSVTIRQNISHLLSESYNVSTAESGVAAIRTITLNRPDLVLLDYEMPVCDGRQTLEMLRSEQSFKDLPVIFLTGQSDPGIVRQLVSLRPSGYLLKYLKPAEIKKKIDAFFEKRKAGAAAAQQK